jgi:hypothetical protein
VEGRANAAEVLAWKGFLEEIGFAIKLLSGDRHDNRLLVSALSRSTCYRMIHVCPSDLSDLCESQRLLRLSPLLSLFQETPTIPFNLHVLAHPSNALTVPLPHHHTAHEHLDRPDPLEWDLPLPRRLVQSQLVSQFILADCIGVVDLVSEDQEGDFREIFHGEEGVEFGFRLGEAFVVFGVDEEDDSGHFREVVAP